MDLQVQLFGFFQTSHSPFRAAQFGSEAGGTRAAIILSVIETCRRHGLEPFAYRRNALTRLPTHPTDRLAELLPVPPAASTSTP